MSGMADPEVRKCVNAMRSELKSRAGCLSYGYGKSGIPGTTTIEAYHEDMPMPLGVVWYSFAGLNCVQIYSSFVDGHYRRCGIRTYLHEKLLAAYPHVERVLSGAGTKSGMAWMKAVGYKKTAAGWEYHRKKPR